MKAWCGVFPHLVLFPGRVPPRLSLSLSSSLLLSEVGDPFRVVDMAQPPPCYVSALCVVAPLLLLARAVEANEAATTASPASSPERLVGLPTRAGVVPGSSSPAASPSSSLGARVVAATLAAAGGAVDPCSRFGSVRQLCIRCATAERFARVHGGSPMERTGAAVCGADRRPLGLRRFRACRPSKRVSHPHAALGPSLLRRASGNQRRLFSRVHSCRAVRVHNGILWHDVMTARVDSNVNVSVDTMSSGRRRRYVEVKRG